MARAMMSDEPPGGYGTMMCIGLLGQAWASAAGAQRVAAHSAASTARVLRIIVVSLRRGAWTEALQRLVISHRTT